jgi:REP element-mobilizing transposase RayT
MARKPRVHHPTALYHVIMRGNARQNIFFGDEDRCRFYLLLQEGLERYGHRIHAFCLMTNHIHLVIQVGEVSLSRIMQNLTFRYTRWVNWRQGRSGHLFQGRFKAIMVDADAYLLELTRYIHLNPVRAGIVQSPAEYPWSGHLAYLGEESLPWLTTDWVLSQFTEKSAGARLAYSEFIDQGRDEGHRLDYHSGAANDSRILGGDPFIEKVLAQAGARPPQRLGLADIIMAVCREYGIEEQEIKAPGKYRNFSAARGMAAWLILETSGTTLAELSRYTGRDVSTLSAAAKALQLRAKSEQGLAGRMQGLLANFYQIAITKA